MRLLSSALSTDCYPPRLLSLRRFPNLASFTHLSPIINGWQVSDMEIDGGASEVEQDVRPDRNAKAAEVPQSVMLDQTFAFSRVHRYLWRPGGLHMASGMNSNGNRGVGRAPKEPWAARPGPKTRQI